MEESVSNALKSYANQNIQDNAHAIACLVKFCTDVNIGTIENSKYLLKSIVCNMQYIHKQDLYSKLFGADSYVNWELSETMIKRSMSKRKVNSIGGIGSWYYLMFYLQGKLDIFQQLSMQSPSSKNTYRPFYLIVEACNFEFKGTGVQIDFSIMVRLFFTIHLIGIQPVHAISTLLNPIVSKHMMQVSASYAQNMALRILEEKFTPQQYIDTVYWLVHHGVVVENFSVLQREVEYHFEKEKKNADMMKMKNIQVLKSSRPSLIDIAKNRKAKKFVGVLSLKTEMGATSTSSSAANVAAALSNNNTTLDGYFTLDGFKEFMKFPSNFSPLMQQRAYWLASQCCFDWKMYVKDFLPKDLCNPLIEYGSIGAPDENVIYDILNATNLVGAPFHALKLFQVSCLVSFPALERAGLTMNETLRLYIAAYQQKNIWKAVWKSVKPLLSIQIIKDVEKFTSVHEMDHESVVSIILYGTAIPPPGASLKGILLLDKQVDASVSNTANKSNTENVDDDNSDNISICSSFSSFSSMSCVSNVSSSNSTNNITIKPWCIAEVAENRRQATRLAAQKALLNQQRRRPYKYVSELQMVPQSQLMSDTSFISDFSDTSQQKVLEEGESLQEGEDFTARDEDLKNLFGTAGEEEEEEELSDGDNGDNDKNEDVFPLSEVVSLEMTVPLLRDFSQCGFGKDDEREACNETSGATRPKDPPPLPCLDDQSALLLCKLEEEEEEPDDCEDDCEDGDEKSKFAPALKSPFHATLPVTDCG